MRLEYRLLGPVEVRLDGEPLDLGVYKQRALLALLLINANNVVSTDRIIDELWSDSAGRDRQKALWVVVSRLRSVLEPDRKKRTDGSIILSRPPGYLVSADPENIDATRFEALATEGRALLDADPAAASLVLTEALALWRGHPLEEFTYEEFAAAEVRRLEELRLAAVENRIDADLRVGRAAELIGELESLVRQHPARERMTAHLMLALHLAGRQGDALRAFGTLRTHLAEELGLEPSDNISRLEEQIVLDDPSLRERPGAAASSGAEPGLTVRGYELRDKIGQGAMGNVYRAFQPAMGREVAIKVIRPELANDPAFIRRFEAEAQAIAQLEHPQIVPVFDYWREPDAAFLVMRRFEHGSLRDVLGAGTMTFDGVIDVVEQVGRALAAAHRRGVTHGDIKPENVLIDSDGHAYLADFGMSYGPTGTNAGGGTPSPFVAPEQVATGRVTVTSDIFSLGALASDALTDALPGTTSLSPSVSDVIGRATAVRPGERFEDVESFVAALAIAAGDETDTALDVGEVANPYRGLHAFGESDADRFFGRERLVERLLARLGHTGPQGRFVAVVGPSGSGKSSVVRAGVIPALRQAALPGSDRWFVVTMTPGRHPFEALEDALRTVAIDPPGNLLERLTVEGIAAAVESVIADAAAQIVILIDQLEELFALASPADADAFMAAIVEAARDRHSSVKIIATLRADFYDRPLRHPEFGELLRLGTEVVTPMDVQELERAITAPAGLVGVAFEGGLVAEIASDMAGQSTALPLLQYALTELFEQRTGSTIGVDGYQALGGVSAALARRADGLYDGLSTDEQSRARDVFLRLVTLNEAGADTRRRALLSELNGPNRDSTELVLDAFGRHRLLSFDRDIVTRGPTVEIAHEALLSEWKRLRNWIDDARVDLQAERSLAAAEAEWSERDHDPEFLLTGARLGRYDGWLQHPPVSLTSHEHDYLAASHDQTAAERQAERRRVRRLHRLVAGVGVALVLALIAGGFAFRQQRRATAETERAELATLISRSAAAIGDDPELAVLLALEANEREPGDDTRRALLGALGGASVANKVLSRAPLDGDCITGGDSFYTISTQFGIGPIQLSVIDGAAMGRDVVSGEEYDFGPLPMECALGARDGMVGSAGDIEGRLWVGPNYDIELDIRGSALATTADRTIVAGGTSPDTAELRLYDQTGNVVGQPIVVAFTTGQALNRDNSLFAVSVGLEAGRNPNGVLYVIDTETGLPILAMDAPLAHALAFDPTSGDLIAGLADGTVATFDPLTGERRSQVSTGETFGYLAAGARPDGTLVMVSRGAIELIDRSSGPIGRPFPLQNARQAFVRPDGLVVTIQNDGSADVYDLDANAVVDRIHNVLPRGWVATVDGTAAVVQDNGDEDAAVELIDLSTGERRTPELVLLDGSTFPGVAIYPATDGVWAVAADHRLARWRDGVLVDELYMGSEPGVRHDDWYPGGRMFGDLFAVLGTRSDGVHEATLIRLGGPSNSGAEIVFTVETEMNDNDQDNRVGMAHPSATGGLFVVDDAGRLTEYGPTGDVVTQVETGTTGPVAITLDPTGAKLAISFGGGVTTVGVAIVDVATGEVEQVPGPSIASSLGFNGDGSVLGISVWGGEVRLYDVGSGEVPPIIWDGTGTFGAEPGWYDPETASLWLPASGQVLEIPLDPASWVAKACEIVDRELTPEEWTRYVPGDEPLRSACI